MELVSPAGNFEKLNYAWEYGADAAYIGLKNFSLRTKADNFFDDEYKNIEALKNEYKKRGLTKKLFCAINITFHNSDLKAFFAEADYFKKYPFDAFIVQDIGIASVLKKMFPDIPLHLSTQANCINYEAVKVYRSLGFSRIVLGREADLNDIAEIKQKVPEMQLECFAHGAMCIAYSGRCLVSAYLTNRSANAGSCSHSCRWNYKLLSSLKENSASFAVEESERAGEYFPIEEGENYTAMFSSKDLCMIDHLDKLKQAGADAIKIEGRMKSIYYTALTARSYRKQLDYLDGKITEAEAKPFVNELYNTAHREFATGFYFSSEEANKTTAGETKSPYMLAGTIGKKISSDEYEFISMNKINAGVELEYVGPDICSIKDNGYILLNPETKEKMDWVCHGHGCIIKTAQPVAEKFLVRCKV
ncbi:peptidase U32 family protein [Treponema pedis]|uniref:peptidase U32 family protein n=1 Tax=Treponema pedis TaxID=409322 RepID=UPI000429B075|nr:peptidase U32 family protein [Treponema pedis]